MTQMFGDQSIRTFTVEMWNGVGAPNIGTMTVSYFLSTIRGNKRYIAILVQTFGFHNPSK